MADFPTIDEALASADSMVAKQRRDMPHLAEGHPDNIAGHKLLDQFWYGNFQGTTLYKTIQPMRTFTS